MDKKLVELYRARVKEAENAIAATSDKRLKAHFQVVLDERKEALVIAIEHSQAAPESLDVNRVYTPVQYNCAMCQGEFVPTAESFIFCSTACSQAYNNLNPGKR